VIEPNLAGGDQMGEHRTPGDLVRRLGKLGFHARAQAGGQDDGGGGHELIGSGVRKTCQNVRADFWLRKISQ